MIPLPRPTARASVDSMRAIFGRVITSVGWIVLGTALLIGGLIWGLNSHQVSYVTGEKGVYNVYFDPGFVYFQQEKTSNYYVMHLPDFTPQIDGVIEGPSLTSTPGSFSFIARTDTIHVNHSGSRFCAFDGSRGGDCKTINFAHPIEKITLNGTTYISDEYTTYPNGYTINNWLDAGPLMLMGAVFVGLAIFFLTRSRKRQKRAAAAERAALDAIPSPFARELAEEARQSSE